MTRLMTSLCTVLAGVLFGGVWMAGGGVRAVKAQVLPFDHDYAAYGALLRDVVREPQVDYQRLKDMRAALAAVEASFAAVPFAEVMRWPRDQQMAFWINAYNLLTLRAIVNHYPIKGSWLSLGPRNSIRQIDGVWTKLTWSVAGRSLTLDDIEHKILRPEFKEPLVHFAVNCASASCPVLASTPYRAAGLHARLESAATWYLASPHGLSVAGTTVSVSSIFKWYGGDFVEQFQSKGPSGGAAVDRAVLGAVATYGPEAARVVALGGRARVRFLDYDWSLNDISR